jgi:hypothetical protein
MTVSLEEMIARQTPESQQKIAEIAAQFIAEELTLRELRRLRKLTQSRLSRKLKIGQEGISRIEKRTDLYLSTLRGYVEGVGGKLSLIVEFPDHPAVVLSGLGQGADEQDVPKTAKKKAKTGVRYPAKSAPNPGHAV